MGIFTANVFTADTNLQQEWRSHELGGVRMHNRETIRLILLPTRRPMLVFQARANLRNNPIAITVAAVRVLLASTWPARIYTRIPRPLARACAGESIAKDDRGYARSPRSASTSHLIRYVPWLPENCLLWQILHPHVNSNHLPTFSIRRVRVTWPDNNLLIVAKNTA